MQYNVNNPSIKRILREVKEMEAEPSNQYTAAPLEENLFEWHFTIRGPAGTEFEGGLYHGRIILPPEYPFKPPNIVLLNHSGRFEVGTKICLSISSYHPEHWQPSWSIRTVLVALISFMPTKGEGAIGAIDYPPEERRKFAAKSVNFICEKCGARMCDVFPSLESPPPSNENIAAATTTTTTTTIPTTVNNTASDENSPPSPTVKDNSNNSHSSPAPPTKNENIYPVVQPPKINTNLNKVYINNNSNNMPPPLQHEEFVGNELQGVAPFMAHAQANLGAHLSGQVGATMPLAPAAVAPVRVEGVSAQATDSQLLDYMIVAIAVAILALVVRKMLSYSTEV